ncbi:MAG: hypothetical protein WEB78_13350 [Ilumatobacteraceae bacterium]
MTIRKGDEWGTVGALPADAVVVPDDAALHELVNASRRDGTDIPPVVLHGGDLHRALGGTPPGDRLGGRVALLPIDVVRVDADGRTAWFAAHLLARGSWWRGRVVGAMNAQHRGTWDVAPRSHPNDGRVDIVDVAASMTPRDRWRASRRIDQGTHVPHPSISVRQATETTISFDAPLQLWLDGVPWGSAATITLTVEPDAFLACV